MARVTVEDCIEQVPNRFELVILAGQRAKQLASGSPLTVDKDNDKDAVISLREIAETTIDLAQLSEDLITSHTKRQVAERMERDVAKFDKKKSLEDQVSEAFKDANQHAEEEEQQAPEAAADGAPPSFASDNVDVED